MKNEPIVLFTNQKAVDELQSKLDALLPNVERLTAEYFKLPYARKEVTLEHIITGSEADKHAYLCSLIPDEVSFLKINKSQAVQSGLFKLPSFPEFDSVLDLCKFEGIAEYLNYFTIKGINYEAVKLFEERSSIIAKTEDELSMYQMFQDFLNIAEALDMFMCSYADYPIIPKGSGIISLSKFADNKEGKWSISPKLFEALSKRLRKFDN